jgi:hypothetical protein
MVDVGGVPAVATGWGDGGGSWMGMLLVIALLGGGFGGGFGRGFGGGYGAGCGAEGRIENRMDFDFIRSGQFGLQKDICQVGYLNEKNTGAIIHNQDIDTGKILERMSQNELREAYAKIAEQATLLSEQKITATILGSLQPPRPIPAYPVPNPYVPYNSGCGCGFPYGA